MKNKNILLITGGTGSFGKAVLNQFLKSDKFQEIRIFSRDEKKQDELRNELKNPNIKFYIGDVRDRSSIDSAMVDVDYVFHAAALKQVPTGEFFPWEVIKTNAMGALNVIDSAIRQKVKKMIVLSTDKAVYPINAMGMSKALMEKIMIAKSRETNHSTILCGTRYGNVMASRGSVIPLFIEQIKSGKPITITDPNMTRFMMSLKGAVELVLYAFEHGEPGDMFVQKAPAATIKDLAQALSELYDADNEIKIIGTRHGEKLFESLVNREEMVKAIDLGKYYRIPADTRDLNYALYFSKGQDKVSKVEEYTSHNTERLDIEGVKKMLLQLDIVKDDIVRNG
jgi:UDP-glucose 4-epimerase